MVAGHSPGTVRIRRSYITRLGRRCPDPWRVTLADLVEFLAVPTWKTDTRAAGRSAVRSFYSWALVAGHVDRDPSLQLPRVAVPAGQPRPVPADVADAALQRASGRERLMLLLALHAGLRRSEIARVHTRDVVDGCLRVTGKGGKVRTIPLSDVLADALAARPAGWVFPGAIDGHLSADRVGKIVTGLLGDGWTTHTARHRFATTGYAVERDLLAMQQLLGHAKPETTARYAAVPAGALRRAVAAAAGRPTADVVDLARRRALRDVHGTYCAAWLELHWHGVSAEAMTMLRRSDIDTARGRLRLGVSTVDISADACATLAAYMAKVDWQLGPRDRDSLLFVTTSGDAVWPQTIEDHCREHLAPASG